VKASSFFFSLSLFLPSTPLLIHIFYILKILEGVSLGMDVIATPLPTLLTKNGQALSVPFHLGGSEEKEDGADVSQVMNLRDAKYRKDATPLVYMLDGF
jgi:queuine/archaeosine tRNA-ribosyltransferase